ncbi:6-pyruvoyl tetrahydrobiopterin synthase, partial [Fragariocoptes setiger]
MDRASPPLSIADSTSSDHSISSDHPILSPNKVPTPVVYLTRVETFCAGHRLHNLTLDAETNRQLFGKCNNPNGHGHNYKVEVTIKGPVDRTTGMVMNLHELRDIMAMVIDPMDHKMLDQDLEHFCCSTTVTTAENIAVYMWNKMSKLLPQSTEMVNLRLHETDKHYVDYRGDMCND